MIVTCTQQSRANKLAKTAETGVRMANSAVGKAAGSLPDVTWLVGAISHFVEHCSA